MNQEQAELLITERFYTFKNKLVDEYPEYKESFETIISDAYDNNCLWHLLEKADNNLKELIKNKGGIDNLLGKDYYNALWY
jgi:hypothetical protein